MQDLVCVCYVYWFFVIHRFFYYILELFRQRCPYCRRCLDYIVFITTKPDAVICRIDSNLMVNDPLINTWYLAHLTTDRNELIRCLYNKIPHDCDKKVWRVSFKKQELLNLRQHLGSPSGFGEVCDAHPYSLLCCVFCVLFVVVLCFVCPMLPVSLDCSF